MLVRIISKYWKLILIFTVVGASASFGLSLAQKPVYVAESRLLIRYIQTQGVDAYAASRAAGKIGQIFAEVSRTELFLEKVLETPYGKDLPVPPQSDLISRKEFWEKTIDVSTGIDSSMVRVRAYSDDPHDPKRYVEAVSYVLLTSGAEFHGANGLVSVRLVDGPVSFKKSVVSSVAMFGIGGLFLGALIGFMVSSLLFAIRSMGTQTDENRVCIAISNSDIEATQKPFFNERSVGVLQPEPESNREKNGLMAESMIDTAPSHIVSKKELLPKSSENAQTQKREFQLTKPAGSVVRTVFDDLQRLGLDPKQLTMNS